MEENLKRLIKSGKPQNIELAANVAQSTPKLRAVFDLFSRCMCCVPDCMNLAVWTDTCCKDARYCKDHISKPHRTFHHRIIKGQEVWVPRTWFLAQGGICHCGCLPF